MTCLSSSIFLLCLITWMPDEEVFLIYLSCVSCHQAFSSFGSDRDPSRSSSTVKEMAGSIELRAL